jgi:RNA polymerase sigma factor (sigma-70 family)
VYNKTKEKNMFPTNLIKCSSCQKEKAPSEFHRRGNKTQKICRECRNADARAVYAEHGKSRKTPQIRFEVNPNNLPPLAERITALESKLQAKAASFAHDGMDADDICSEMVEAILTKCEPDDTDAFLMQCASWTAQAYISKRVSYSEYVQDLDIDEEAMEAAGFKVVAARTVEDALVQREMFAQFEAVIKSLPAENQKVVAMISIGMSQREIAGELHVSEQTISERMKKIREQLSGMEINLQFSFAQ